MHESVFVERPALACTGYRVLNESCFDLNARNTLANSTLYEGLPITYSRDATPCGERYGHMPKRHQRIDVCLVFVTHYQIKRCKEGSPSSTPVKFRLAGGDLGTRLNAVNVELLVFDLFG